MVCDVQSLFLFVLKIKCSHLIGMEPRKTWNDPCDLTILIWKWYTSSLMGCICTKYEENPWKRQGPRRGHNKHFAQPARPWPLTLKKCTSQHSFMSCTWAKYDVYPSKKTCVTSKFGFWPLNGDLEMMWHSISSWVAFVPNMKRNKERTASCPPLSLFLGFVVQEPSRMKYVRTEGCHVGLFREFVGMASWTYGQSNTTIATAITIVQTHDASIYEIYNRVSLCHDA